LLLLLLRLLLLLLRRRRLTLLRPLEELQARHGRSDNGVQKASIDMRRARRASVAPIVVKEKVERAGSTAQLAERSLGDYHVMITFMRSCHGSIIAQCQHAARQELVQNGSSLTARLAQRRRHPRRHRIVYSQQLLCIRRL
jgi:hypothetical protein